jgi:integrase
MPGKVIKLGRKFADDKPRYRARWHSVFDKRGEHKYRARNFRTDADAAQWITLMDRADRSDDADDAAEVEAPVTFGEFVEVWRGTHAKTLQPRSQTRYGQILRVYLLPAWGSTPLADIDRKFVKTYFNALAFSTVKATGKPMTAGTLKKVVTVASSVMSEAFDLDYAASNPVARLNAAKPIERTDDPSETLHVLTVDEIDKLADAIPTYRVAILTAGHAGPRASELWALQVRDIDLTHAKGPRIHVRRALKRTYGQGRPTDAPDFGLPKNGKTRVVRIPQWLADELAAHVAGLPDQDPDRIVFTAPEGGVVRHELFMGRRFRPGVAKLGLSIRFHDLRHSFASLLIADGASDLQVQGALGHSDARSTAIYSHLFEGHDDDLLSRRQTAYAARKAAA